MTSVRFVVDAVDWVFDEWDTHRIEPAIDRLLDRIEVARERNEKVAYGADLFTRAVMAGRSIWELFGPGNGPRLSRELQERLSAAFSTATRWDDGDDWPDSFEIVVDGHAEENPDVAWAHQRVAGGTATGLLGVTRHGKREVSAAGKSLDLHWVGSDAEHVGFFRQAIDLERDSEATLERFAPHAFPNLFFHSDVWAGLGNLSGGYRAVRLALRNYLAVLDDHGEWVFTAPPPAVSRTDTAPASSDDHPSNQLIERRFQALGLDVAPEKPNVRHDNKCREARERALQGRVIYCEWHGKLEPHQNRVHLHPPVPESGNRVVIGVIHEHLPLP